MKRPPCTSLAIGLFLAAGLIPAFAGSAGSQVLEVPPAPAVSPWTFDATLYGWLTGLDGDIGIGGFDVGFDESFLDIVDDLNFAAMLRFEARNGRWGAIVDGFYVDLGVSGNPPGPLYDSAGVEMSQFIGELAVAYRVYEGPSGFVDLYGGFRYNSLTNDLAGTLSQSGIQSTSAATGAGVVNAMEARAEAIAQPVAAGYQAATAAERAAIEAELTAAIEAEADAKVKEDIKRKLIEINRDNGRDGRVVEVERFNTSVKAVRAELASATAELEVAKLRASVDATAQAEVVRAEARVAAAEQDLSTAIAGQLKTLPTKASAKQDWLDPIVGVRAQWNINEQWYLACKSDIGGFSVGSNLAWTLQATVGYNFNERFSAELGYRYLHTDYSEGSFDYDVAQAGIYTGFNFRF